MERTSACAESEYLIENVPNEIWGEVGDSFTNWVYQQGFFAALIKCFTRNESLKIVDFGCGHGKLAPVSVFFTHPEGEYLGIDIQESYINYCRRKYVQLPRVRFHVSKDYNPLYSPQQQSAVADSKSYGGDWPVSAESIDVVIAISVFTHLREADAFGYINKIHNILKPDTLAILTCHIVEEPRKQPGFIFKYNPFLVSLFKFITPLPTSYNWFTSNPALPESGIAVNMAGLNSLIQGKFKVERIMRGSATGGSDPLPQDVVVLRKLTLPIDKA
jgi:SAM-dependent methyltransferase